MIQSLWKPATVLLIVVALIVAMTFIPWHRLLYSQQRAEQILSKQIQVEIDVAELDSNIKRVAARKAYIARTGYNGSNRNFYAQISYGSCLIAMQQLSGGVYQADYYVLDGFKKTACRYQDMNEFLGLIGMH